MKRIAVLTTGRQDWGILRSTCAALRDDGRFDLRLLVGGMHCHPAFGKTEEFIVADGFEAAERLLWITGEDRPADEAGRALGAIAGALQRQEPDALLIVGDRYETATAAIAATIGRVPIVHLHGGEETAGAIDDAFRHAITKLSHLHLVSHPEHAQRVEALGESPDTIHVVGAPGLDNMRRSDLADRAALEAFLGIPLVRPVVVVTVHPATLTGDPLAEVRAVAGAMERVPATYVITLPNNDPGHEPVRRALVAASGGRRRIAVEALGDRLYWGLMSVADAMLGNSSSGLIEAPAVGLPAVNVGDRQLGRLRGDNVIDVRSDADAVAAALRTALDGGTRARLAGTTSPYGDGRAAEQILRVLAAWTPPHPPRKAPVRRATDHGEARDLILIGGGEHARVLVDAARSREAWNVIGYADPQMSPVMDAIGIPWLGDDRSALGQAAGRWFIVAVGGLGRPGRRQAIIAQYANAGIAWATVVHSSAVVASGAALGPGVAVLARAVVNPGAHVGAHSIVNTGAIVEHDVEVGPFAHIGPGAVVGGGAEIGSGALIGLGARVRDHVRVGDRAIVGMGAVVVDAVQDEATVAGVPARELSLPGHGSARPA